MVVLKRKIDKYNQSVKVDPVLKKEAQEVAKAIGLPMSIVVAAELREFVRTRSLTISDSPRLKPEVEAELRAISKEVRAGKNVSPAFTDLQDAFKWLDGAK